MRRRIVGAIVGSVVVTLLLFGLPLAWVVAENYGDDLRLELESAALTAAPDMTERAADVPPAEPPLQPPGVRVAYYDSAGRFVSGRGPRVADEVVVRAVGGQNGLATHVIAIPVVREHRVVGIIRAEEEPERLAARIHRAWLLMAALALGIIVTVTALAVAVVRRLTAPMHDLADAARRLEAGDFAVAPRPSGIEELDSAGLALAAAARRLEGVLARERALTADVTHQLKTPLTALSLELDGAEDRSSGLDPARLRAEVDRLESTIASILALARDDSSARAPIELHPVVIAARADWLRRAHAAGRAIVATGEPGTPPVRVSARALRQILDVLVDNALAHGTGTVTVATRGQPGGVEITVGDEGTAVPIDGIFSRRSASAHGQGIGLALARSLAEAEGGRLNLLTGEPATTFSLFFLTEGDV